MALALERSFCRAGAFSRRLFAAPGAALCEIALCLALCSLFAAFWRRQLYSGPPRLGQTNGDRLLWRSGAVFAFPNVFHFFAHKLARLSGRRLAFALIFARAFNRFFFWHNKMISPLATRLDVKESGGSYLPPLVGSKEPVLSSRLADHRPVARHLVFHARAADVRAPHSLDLSVSRLAVRGKWICPVHLDFVVCP
jgi:hypothetical protein